MSLHLRPFSTQFLFMSFGFPWFSFISYHFLNMSLHLPPNSSHVPPISLHFLSSPFVFFHQFPPIPFISPQFLPAPLQILFILFVSFGFLLFPVSACHVPSVLRQFLPFPFIPLARQMSWATGRKVQSRRTIP